MQSQAVAREFSRQPAVLSHAPEELTRGRLRRVGEGIGRVVYASEHWVVKRERSPAEIVSLIVLWRWLRKFERFLPGGLGRRLMQRPARQIRFLRILVHGVMAVAPKALWYSSHVRAVWRQYHHHSTRGETLARDRLLATSLIPARVTFPPTQVSVGGWPGWLTVSEAIERVESTLTQRLAQLAKAGRYDEIEQWLDRFLMLRQSGWKMGLFSVDAHLKNFGVTGDRIVLLDTGGLTNRWTEVERRLRFEEAVGQPHIQLGLGPVLRGRPEIAERFNARWKSVVNRATVRDLWPADWPR